MKHQPAESTASGILRALSAAGIRASDLAIEGLSLHLDAVLAGNEVQNLTAISEPADAVELHVADSLTALPEVEDAPAGPMVDIGSGAGYPGIPLAIVSGRPATLVESVGKKARFLRDVATQLGGFGSLTVAQERAESLGPGFERRFAVATARAVSSLASLVELASPLLMEGGRLIALKGTLGKEELERGKVAGRMVGMAFRGARELRLPGGQARTIIVFERTERLPEVNVPRSPGKAQRKPLG